MDKYTRCDVCGEWASVLEGAEFILYADEAAKQHEWNLCKGCAGLINDSLQELHLEAAQRKVCPCPKC